MRGSGTDASDTASSMEEQRLLSELRGMRLRELRKRAKEVGVSSNTLESAMDSDEPEGTVIDLIVARSGSAGEDRPHFVATKDGRQRKRPTDL